MMMLIRSLNRSVIFWRYFKLVTFKNGMMLNSFALLTFHRHPSTLIFAISAVIETTMSPTGAEIHPYEQVLKYLFTAHLCKGEIWIWLWRSQKIPSILSTSLKWYKYPLGKASTKPYLLSQTFISVDPRLSYIRIFYFGRHCLSILSSMNSMY